MREIKFRGMAVNGKWHIGNLSVLTQNIRGGAKAGMYISNSCGMPFAYEIRPETVGQFTGFHDKNGKEIYEGDIVNAQNRIGWDNEANPIYGEMNKTYVEWQNPEVQFGFSEYEYENGEQCYIPFEKARTDTLEVIGNIHEIPEMLEKTK